MGIGVRAFLIVEGNVSRVPFRQLERLLCGDAHEVMGQYAGQRIRCALAYVELVNRRPVAVRHVDYMVLPFASDGRLDGAETERGQRLAIASTGSWFGAVSEPVVEFAPYLAARRYRTEFKWVPTQAEVEALMGQALKA
jgi:hypothetical protein